MWSFRGNACDIPTDCPTRERAGWTGDWQLYVPTAAFLYDVGRLLRRSGCATSPPPSGPTARVPQHVPDARPPSENGVPRAAQRLGRLGRRRRPGAVGDVPGVRRHRRARASSGRRWCAGSTASSGWRRGAPPVRVGGAPRAAHRTSSTSGTPASTGASGSSRAATRRLRRRSSRATRPTSPPRIYAWSAAARRADRRAARARRRGRRATPSSPPTCVDAWRTEFLDADGRITPHTQANLVRALTLRPGPRRAAAARRRRPRRAGPRRPAPTSHRLPRHARPAAGARGPRPPRRGVRAAVPGHRALVAGDDRPRRDHRVGALGGHRRATACRTSRSTTTPRVR